MKSSQNIPQKIFTKEALLQEVMRWRLKNKKIVFTNGVFDILHTGHIASLHEAASHGDVLIIGLNSDASVKRLKGTARPVNPQDARALLLASLLVTDAIVIFDEDTPRDLIVSVMPDVLVKGGDYTVDTIAGANFVTGYGGSVEIIPFVEGYSTSSVIANIKKL